MSLRHALLGLLREGPASGYDLLRIFRRSLHNAWPATQSQVYTELTKLADAGLLSVTAQGPRGRKEYALTEAGLAELRRWLLETEPDLHPRSDGLLRVFLLGALTHDQARDYLAWLAARSADDVAGLEPARRIEPGAGAGRRAGCDHVAGLQRRKGREVGDQSVEREHQVWRAHERPEWTRLGLTITPQRHRLWIDNPEGTSWPLPS